MAADIKAEVRRGAEELLRTRGITPGLAFILVGDDPGSEVYVRSKGKACEEMRFRSVTERRPATLGEAELLAMIARFNDDPAIHGILVQLPLPPHIDEQRVIEAIDFRKDVDGFHPVNVGKLVLGLKCLRPCTPSGILELLVRSNIVGKPVCNMLMQKQPGANAAVTVVHTGVKDIAPFVRQADIVVAAMGKPRSITGTMLKPGCVVIDVGMNRIPDPSARNGTRLVGDVDFASALEVASAITPVPGGVGLMTIAMLMKNTLQAASGDAGG